MKSFISEDKTVLKAIEKAMAEADFPTIFTIKILEPGILSILWWQNKPAIILFSYEIKEQIEPQDYKKNTRKNIQSYSSSLTKNHTVQSEGSFLKAEYKKEANQSTQKSDLQRTKRIKKKEFESRANPFQSNGSEKKISEGISVQTKNAEPTIHLNSKKEQNVAEAEKLELPFNNIKNNGQKKEKKVVKSQQLPLENSAIDLGKTGKEISEKSVINRREERGSFQEQWKEEYLTFAKNFMDTINADALFSSSPIAVFLEENILIISIENLRHVEGIEKKHLFSSLVIILYEHLKNQFSEFDSKNYKAIIR